MSELLDKMNALACEIAACEKCTLHLSRKNAVPGEGNIRTKILFIGEGPGANENETGRPFCGAAGNFLNDLLEIAGVQRRDVFITNVVKCRPPANRDPLPEELTACQAYLDRQIEMIDPLVIVTLGRYSMGRFFPLQRISQIHGQGKWIHDRLIVPMFHPAAALHNPNLRASIEHDFSLLPGYLKEASMKLYPEVVVPEETKPEEPSAGPDPEQPGSENGATQLSLF